MYQHSNLLKAVFCFVYFLFSDILMLCIACATENANTVLGVQVKRKGIAPLISELGFHCQRLLDLRVSLSSMQDATMATITFEQQVS